MILLILCDAQIEEGLLLRVLNTILICILRSCALQPQIEEGAVLVEEKVWQYHCRLFYSSDLHYV